MSESCEYESNTQLKQRVSVLTTPKQYIACPWLFVQLIMCIKCVFGHTSCVVLACCERVITFVPEVIWRVTFYVISMEFLCLSRRHSSLRNILQLRWVRRNVCFRRLAGSWIVKMSLWFYFTFVCYEWLVVMGYQDFNKVLSRWQKLWSRQRWKKLTPVSRAVFGCIPPGKFLKSGPLRIHFQHPWTEHKCH